jgi:hypothetical protein
MPPLPEPWAAAESLSATADQPLQGSRRGKKMSGKVVIA